MSPILKPPPVPDGLISDARELRRLVTGGWEQSHREAFDAFWGKHAPHLADRRMRASMDPVDDARLLRAWRAAQRERLDYLLANGLIVGAALDAARDDLAAWDRMEAHRHNRTEGEG